MAHWALLNGGAGLRWAESGQRGVENFPNLLAVVFRRSFVSGSDNKNNINHKNIDPSRRLFFTHSCLDNHRITIHSHPSTVKMGFTDLVGDAGLTMLNNWLVSRSYITGYAFFSLSGCRSWHHLLDDEIPSSP